jgi:hypothetical protein
MSWMAPLAAGETPTGPRLRKSQLRSTTPPPGSPGVDIETPPGSPFGNFPNSDPYPRVADPSNLSEGRTVSTKQSNRPFLA